MLVSIADSIRSGLHFIDFPEISEPGPKGTGFRDTPLPLSTAAYGSFNGTHLNANARMNSCSRIEKPIASANSVISLKQPYLAQFSSDLQNYFFVRIIRHGAINRVNFN